MVEKPGLPWIFPHIKDLRLNQQYAKFFEYIQWFDKFQYGYLSIDAMEEAKVDLEEPVGMSYIRTFRNYLLYICCLPRTFG